MHAIGTRQKISVKTYEEMQYISAREPRSDDYSFSPPVTMLLIRRIDYSCHFSLPRAGVDQLSGHEGLWDASSLAGDTFVSLHEPRSASTAHTRLQAFPHIAA